MSEYKQQQQQQQQQQQLYSYKSREKNGRPNQFQHMASVSNICLFTLLLLCCCFLNIQVCILGHVLLIDRIMIMKSKTYLTYSFLRGAHFFG